MTQPVPALAAGREFRPASTDPITNASRSVVCLKTNHSTGTGFVLHDSQTVATNFHVVDGASEIIAIFQDGTHVRVDGFVAASPLHDLAVLHLEKPAKHPGLLLATDDVPPGTDVFAIGMPAGLGFSVSKGVVSAYRSWKEIEEAIGPGHLEDDSKWVQTTTPISHGNSGGPLLTSDGVVLAINTLFLVPEVGQNLNFSIRTTHLTSLLSHQSDSPKPLAHLPASVKHKAGKLQPRKKTDATPADLVAWDMTAESLGIFVCRAFATTSEVEGHRVSTLAHLDDVGWKLSKELGFFSLERKWAYESKCEAANAEICRASQKAATKIAREALCTLEELDRIPSDALSRGVAAHVSHVRETIKRCYEISRPLSDAASHIQTNDPSALCEVRKTLLDLKAYLSVEAVALSQRLQAIYDCPLGSAVAIGESDLEEGLGVLAKEESARVLFDCDSNSPLLEVLSDSAGRGARYGNGKAALQMIVERYPKSDEAVAAKELMGIR